MKTAMVAKNAKSDSHDLEKSNASWFLSPVISMMKTIAQIIASNLKRNWPNEFVPRKIRIPGKSRIRLPIDLFRAITLLFMAQMKRAVKSTIGLKTVLRKHFRAIFFAEVTCSVQLRD